MSRPHVVNGWGLYLHANAKLGLARRLALLRAVEDVFKRSANRGFLSQSEMQNLHAAGGIEHVLEQVWEQSVRKLWVFGS
jgi:hypothetical protein